MHRNNAGQAQNQADFKRQYDGYSERFETLKAKHDELTAKKTVPLERADSFRLFIGVLKNQKSAMAKFDDRLWQTTVKQVTVDRDGSMRFEFYNGSEIRV